MRNSSKNKQLSGFRTLEELGASTDPRAPHATYGNANHLFGDPLDEGFPQVFSTHKAAYGDPYDQGDIDDEDYGDADDSSLAVFESVIGDVEDDDDDFGDADYGDADYGDADYGDTRAGRAFRRVGSGLKTGARKVGKAVTSRTGRRVLAAGAIGTGAYFLGKKVLQARKARRARKNAVARNLQTNRRRMTIQNQLVASRSMGKLPKNAHMPFFQVSGATLNASPISPTEFFVADTLKYNLDMQSTHTPFQVDTIAATYAGVTYTINAPGLVAARYYASVFLVIGINSLSGNPGTIFNVAATLPTFGGSSLVITAGTLTFLMASTVYNCRVQIYPWQLVTNKAVLALGSYSNATPIVVTITGIPANAAVSMIIPGSMHRWSITMRNRLL